MGSSLKLVVDSDVKGMHDVSSSMRRSHPTDVGMPAQHSAIEDMTVSTFSEVAFCCDSAVSQAVTAAGDFQLQVHH